MLEKLKKWWKNITTRKEGRIYYNENDPTINRLCRQDIIDAAKNKTSILKKKEM